MSFASFVQRQNLVFNFLPRKNYFLNAKYHFGQDIFSTVKTGSFTNRKKPDNPDQDRCRSEVKLYKVDVDKKVSLKVQDRDYRYIIFILV